MEWYSDSPVAPGAPGRHKMRKDGSGGDGRGGKKGVAPVKEGEGGEHDCPFRHGLRILSGDDAADFVDSGVVD